MKQFSVAICLTVSCLLGAGCQCFPVTNTYSNVVDDLSDYKAELDPWYVPGLDISRTGMPDWQQFGWNDVLCPCADGVWRRNQRPVYYPAEYRTKFWAMQSGEEPSAPVREQAPEPELAPLPLPGSDPLDE